MTENGVWKISRMYRKSIEKTTKDLEESFQTKHMQAMADLWETYIQTANGHDQLKAQHFET